MKNSDLNTDLQLCEQAGYDFIEIRLDKLREYLKTNTLEDLANFFRTSHIKPYAFNALEFITFRDMAGYDQIKADLKFLCEAGSKIGCHKIVVVPTFDVGEKTRDEIKKESIRVLHELADIAGSYEMKLAYEFVGYPNCSVNTFGQTYDIVTAVNRDNVGLVLDCFHFHAMNSRLEDLLAAEAKKIFIFHIDDSKDYPPGFLRDNNRVWPGDGVVDLAGILTALQKIGYSEMASVELFNPEYWELPAKETIIRGYEKTKAVLANYFKQ